jgi:lipopolysaccharide exporter
MNITQKIKTLITPSQKLSQRVIFAGFWSVASRVCARGLGVVRIIVLARLLAPEAFGLVAVGLLAIDMMYAFTSTGFTLALIQRKGDIRDYLNTAWVMNVLRGLVIAGILFGGAPLIASFFDAPEAYTIVQVMAALVLIQGFNNPGLVYLGKELEIHKSFLLEITQVFADLTVSIIAAIILRSAWALVFGAIASNVTYLLVSYLIHPYRPRLKFDFSKAKTMFNFGKWLTINSWFNYLSQRGDSIIIGRMMGTVSLGFYQIARRVSELFSQDIITSNMDVTFPAYSKLQDNIPKLRQAFLLSLETLASLVFPLSVAIFLLAPDFTPVILGEKWIPAIPAMRILGIAAAFQCILSIGKSMFYSVGRPALGFGMNQINMVVMFALFYPLIKLYGLEGAAMAALIGSVSALPFLVWRLTQLLKIKARDYLHVTLSPIAIILIMVVGIIAIKQIPSQTDLPHLILLLSVVVIIFIGMSILLWKAFKSGPLQIIGLIQQRNKQNVEVATDGSQKNHDETFKRFYDIAKKYRIRTSKTYLKFSLNHLFKDVCFEGKSVLDIGAGFGLHSLYAACGGARPIVCLEPEMEEDSRGAIKFLNELGSHFPEGTIIPLRNTFQNFDYGDQKFDIIISHYSINHLDEHACINLQRSAEAHDKYREIFAKLSKIMNPGGKLILVDCSRYNFYTLLGLRNPMWPEINWRKHQTPWVWARMLSKFGFVNRKITWIPSRYFGAIGSFLTGNLVGSFFLRSAFILTMDKEKDNLR